MFKLFKLLTFRKGYRTLFFSIVAVVEAVVALVAHFQGADGLAEIVEIAFGGTVAGAIATLRLAISNALEEIRGAGVGQFLRRD